MHATEHNADPVSTRDRSGIREILLMSWPIILGNLSYTIMDFADKWMVAKLGTEALAAIGSSGL